VLVFTFSSAIGRWERVVDFGNTTHNSNNLLLGRWSTDNTLQLEIYNGGTSICQVERTVQPNLLLNLIATYNPSNQIAQLQVNGATSSVTCSAAAVDRSFTNSYVGRGFGDEDLFNGNIKGLFVVDQYLNPTAANAVVTAISQGKDMLLQAATTECSVCQPGEYSAAGSLSCDLCPAGTYQGNKKRIVMYMYTRT